jgi:hypothetical protein
MEREAEKPAEEKKELEKDVVGGSDAKDAKPAGEAGEGKKTEKKS